VDGGDLSWKSARLPKVRKEQQRKKAALQHESYALSGIDAMVPGEGDISLGWKWLKRQVERHELPMVAANLTCGGSAPFPATRVVERDGVRLGFVGVLGTGLIKESCQVSDPEAALKSALESMGEVDQVVVLAHGKPTLDRLLAKVKPGLGLVVSGHSKRSLPSPTLLPGGSIQLGAGSRGKKVGVATVQLVQGGQGFDVKSAVRDTESKLESAQRRSRTNKERIAKSKDERLKARAEARQVRLDQQVADLEAELEAQKQPSGELRHVVDHVLTPLGEDLEDHAATHALVEQAKESIDAIERALVKQPNKAIGGAFVGSNACAGCHAEQHAQWKATPHAYAWATLEKVKRTQDLDCWSCHATGAQHPRGPKHPSEAKGLENVGCESCHGPGAAHVAANGQAKMIRRPPEKICTGCHDGVKDEGKFEPASYFGRVVH